MIQLKFSGICEGCDKAELKAEAFSYTRDGNSESKFWEVECEHFEACQRMYDLFTGKESRK